MHLIEKVRRKIRKNSNNCDNVTLLNKKGSNKRKNKKNNSLFLEDSCSVTASVSSSGSGSLLFDDEFDNEFHDFNNSNEFDDSSSTISSSSHHHSPTRRRSFSSSKKGLSYYSPLKKEKSSSSSSTSSPDVISSKLIEEAINDCNGINNKEKLALAIVPYYDNNNNNGQDAILHPNEEGMKNNTIVAVSTEINESNLQALHNDKPSSANESIDNNNQLEIVSEFDRFVSFCNDTISNLCESPIQNTATSFFNFSSSSSDEDDKQKNESQVELSSPPPPEIIQEERQIVEHKPKTPPRPVDALADENGLVHIFHDRLSTLYETPENSMEEKEEINNKNNAIVANNINTLEDEDIIKARWAYAVEMMTLDKQCGSFSDIYEVAEI